MPHLRRRQCRAVDPHPWPRPRRRERGGGRLVLAGTRGGLAAAMDIDGIVFKELDLLGGLGQAHDTELAADIVNSLRYPIEDMVTHVFPLSATAQAFDLFMGRRDGVIHVGLDPNR